MEQKYAIYIAIGLAIGLLFGVMLDNLALGGLAGVFLGWFMAAIQQQRDKQ